MQTTQPIIMESEKTSTLIDQNTTSLSYKFDIKAPIKTDYLKEMPFKGIDGRLSMAIFWSYAGYKEDVLDKLQVLSHRSRAYIYNANGLNGFLVEKRIIRTLELAKKDGSFDEWSRYLDVNFHKLIQQLDFLHESEQLTLLK